MASLIRIFAAWILCAIAANAAAQGYPAKPVRVVVGFSPGGPADQMARLASQKLTEALGQPFVIDFKDGASGIIAASFVAKSAADGYTLMIMTASHTTNPSTQRSLPYDSLKDLAYVSPIAFGDNALVVNPKLPVNSIKDLIALAKAQPGKLNFGSTGPGSSVHLGGELFKLMTGVDMVHVPFKGGSPAILAVISGTTDMVFLPLPITLPQINAGKVRALGVASPKRSKFLPSAPTLDESGLQKFEVTANYGVIVPGAMPRPIIAQLSGTMERILNSADVIKILSDMQLTAWWLTPEQFTGWVREEIEKWAVVTKAIKYDPQ